MYRVLIGWPLPEGFDSWVIDQDDRPVPNARVIGMKMPAVQIHTAEGTRNEMAGPFTAVIEVDGIIHEDVPTTTLEKLAGHTD